MGRVAGRESWWQNTSSKCAVVACLAVMGFSRIGRGQTAGALKATTLRCEYLVDPLAVDVARPRT